MLFNFNKQKSIIYYLLKINSQFNGWLIYLFNIKFYLGIQHLLQKLKMNKLIRKKEVYFLKLNTKFNIGNLTIIIC